jgi:hypothetical protein
MSKHSSNFQTILNMEVISPLQIDHKEINNTGTSSMHKLNLIKLFV